MSNSKRLYRSRTERQVAGVCGGLAEYFKLDPTLVRIIFILITLFGGPGLVLYIILWLVLPDESKAKEQYSEDQFG